MLKAGLICGILALSVGITGINHLPKKSGKVAAVLGFGILLTLLAVAAIMKIPA